jgi:hypothetical protein
MEILLIDDNKDRLAKLRESLKDLPSVGLLKVKKASYCMNCWRRRPEPGRIGELLAAPQSCANGGNQDGGAGSPAGARLQPFDFFDYDHRDGGDGGNDFEHALNLFQAWHGKFSASAAAWPLASVPA